MKIKICGLFREEDIGFANEAMPDYVGFVFAESRRQVSPVKAAKLREGLSAGILPVGVFVNTPISGIAALCRDGVIALVQLHGAEDPPYIAALRERCATPVIKAVSVWSRDAITAWDRSGADFLLLDNGPGGTGTRFNWDLMGTLETGGGADGPERADRRPIGNILENLKTPCFLAGGIDRYTIETALLFRPYGIDVSSGAETGGVKDREKMTELVWRVRRMGV
ncbi:MAG: phosphoribosylanthranilate isomerase [Spirochaetaceae bacterium]|jgi:phosphoribosylanthranilate isomerase|nr:phosphoribosylanthranilate isomerase [Spirochaetaceae bacterium]